MDVLISSGLTQSILPQSLRLAAQVL